MYCNQFLVLAFQGDSVMKFRDVSRLQWEGIVKNACDFCSVLTGVYLKTVMKGEIALLQVKMMMMMILA